MIRSAACAALLACAAGFCLTAPANAGTTVKTKIVNYTIKGTTGAALLEAMDSKGPRRGFTTRAIAQTAYTVGWDLDTYEKAGRCRVSVADAVLNITFNYPELGNALPPDVNRRWQHFMSGVRKHEQHHAQLARAMVSAAEQAVRSTSFDNDPGCRKTQAEIKRRIAKTYAIYEAKQVEFDRVEHSEGGNVDHLVSGLERVVAKQGG
jgi:predicted secreted Zn-dependent protease